MIAEADTKKTPVTVTRGSKPKILSQSVHWIEGTFKGREALNMPLILSPKFTECRARNGYTVGSKFTDGRELWTNPDRPEMGTHWVWNGQACDTCPKDPMLLVKMLQCFGMSFTRLDLAIDAHNFNLSPRRATEEISDGRIKTRAKEFPIRNDARHPGYTQYVGKKASEIHLKLYDKAAEMGVSGDHTRVELTVRHGRADKAAWEIVRGSDFRGLVVSFANFTEWVEWREVMEASPVKLPAERKETSTRLWLLKSCAPALARECLKSGDMAFLEQFKNAVELIYRQMSINVQTVH